MSCYKKVAMCTNYGSLLSSSPRRLDSWGRRHAVAACLSKTFSIAYLVELMDVLQP